MAKTESTAVNDLIKIATIQTPLRQDPSDDLMFAPPSKKDRSIKQHALGPSGTDVPLPRVRAPHSTEQNAISMPAIKVPGAPALPPPSRAPGTPATRTPMPSEYPVVSAVHSQALAQAIQPQVGEIEPVWADDSHDMDVEPFKAHTTAQLAKRRTTLEWMIKLAPVAGAMILLGVVVGGYLVFDGQGGKRRTAAAATVAAAPATPTTPAPTAPAPAAAAVPSITTPAPSVAAIAHRPALVDVRIDSRPSGATVTLVDRGKQTFLGTTPITTAVDPSRAYDVVFSHPRRPTQTAHLDPTSANRLAVKLGRTGTPSTATELAKLAPSTSPANAKPVATRPKATATAKIVEPAWDAQIENAAKAAPVADRAVGGNGTLMISSKPPCEIHVDGTSTGLMTPQRALSLPAGKHKITLVNPAQKIKKSVAVTITANESTKVIQDLTELMK